MTGQEMADTLGLRVEDPAESSFSLSAKVDAINVAQNTVVNLINNAYLTELETVASNKSLTSGSTTFTTASISPIRNGVAVVKVNGGNYCTMMEARDVKRTQNSYLSGSTANPIAYIFDETIHVLPSSTSAIDIWYLSAPPDLSISGSSVSGSSALNEALHEVIVDFAESQLWRMDAQADRAAAAYQSATNQINALNARYEGEAPEGIGTKGRR